jgi:hypothetical protein
MFSSSWFVQELNKRFHECYIRSCRVHNLKWKTKLRAKQTNIELKLHRWTFPELLEKQLPEESPVYSISSLLTKSFSCLGWRSCTIDLHKLPPKVWSSGLKLKNIFQTEFIETSKATSFWILVPITQKINSPIKVQIRSKTLEIFFGKSSDCKENCQLMLHGLKK